MPGYLPVAFVAVRWRPIAPYCCCLYSFPEQAIGGPSSADIGRKAALPMLGQASETTANLDRREVKEMSAYFSARSAKAVIAAVVTAVSLGSGAAATLTASATLVAALASAHPSDTTPNATGDDGTPWT